MNDRDTHDFITMAMARATVTQGLYGWTCTTPSAPGCWGSGRTATEACRNLAEVLARYLTTGEFFVLDDNDDPLEGWIPPEIYHMTR